MKKKKKKLVSPIKPVLYALPQNPVSKTITAKPRVFKVCSIYNISDKTVLSFLNKKGYSGLNSNSLLDEEALKLIKQRFHKDKTTKDIIRGFTTFNALAININENQKSIRGDDIDKETKQYEEPILHLTTNLFDKEKQIITYKKCPVIRSNFSDFEAIGICSKMSSPFARNICNQLSKGEGNRPLLIYQIHYIANKALQLFEGKILTFIYNLRKLNFKNQTANEVKTYSNVIPVFPIISFKTDDTSFKISFFAKKHIKHNKLKADIRLFADKTYQYIGSLDNEGYVLTKLESFRPQLSLFYQKLKGNNFEIYSGVENGYCEICGLELTNPISLRIGIGPICAANLQIDVHEILYGNK